MAANISGFSRSTALKAAVFAVVVSLITVLVMGTCAIFMEGYPVQAILSTSFVGSREFAQISRSLIEMGVDKMYDKPTNYRYSNTPDPSQYILYVTDGNKEYAGSPYKDRIDFERYGSCLVEHKGNINYLYIKDTEVERDRFYQSYGSQDQEITAYLSYKDSYIAQQEELWGKARALWGQYIYRSVVLLSMILVLVIYLMVAAGRSPKDDQLHLMGVDRVFTDLPVAALLLILSGWGALFIFVVVEKLVSDPVIYQVVAFVTAVAAAACLFLWLLLVKKIKARRFWKDTILLHILRWITTPLKTMVEGSRFRGLPFQKDFYLREVSFLAISSIMAMLAILFVAVGSALFFVPLVMELFIMSWYFMSSKQLIKDIGSLILQIDAVNAGELDHQSDIPLGSPLYAASQKINRMGDGMQRSLQSQIKSEMMKVALVTNVSHDLKTPLTSIISYIDLLAKEQDMSEDAREYIKILAEKADRLKGIVADLFDLARSTSGNIQVDAEQLDFKKLIQQTIADMEDQITQSQLTIKQSLPVYDVYIMGDGNKLYRVLQNILGNALKYAMQGTRVYIDLWVEGDIAVASVKNTASYEMDFTKEEVLERFSRGDKARSSEGNGLGLSIAESFTRVCGGNLDVIIDGDQFKVELRFHTMSNQEHTPRE